MPIIKCKMCGGDIELAADKTFGTCEYCGTKQTVPSADMVCSWIIPAESTP